MLALAEARGAPRTGTPVRKRRAPTASDKSAPPYRLMLWGGAISGRFRRRSSSAYRRAAGTPSSSLL